MSLRRPTGTLQMVNLDKWVYDDLQVPLKRQSAQMSIPRPTRTFKYSVWSNDYTTTHSYLWILNLVKWVYHDLLVPSFKYSILSNEYITAYPYFQILNLVKWIYHDLPVPSNTQAGQKNISQPTRTFKYSIWSNQNTMSYRKPLKVHLDNEYATTHKNPWKSQSG